MSNSSLVKYTKLSPNCSSPRSQEIDTITIHCMAGNLSIETCGNVFAPAEVEASSNYGIGSDGRIGMYVAEADRSWATSSRSNDHRAITIEVANNGGYPDWPVSDAALESLITLCADICQRNGIPKLLWQADQSLIGQVDKQNMTVHRWFEQKACPGNYLYNLHSKIAEEVNKRLGVPAASNDETIWNFFKAKGLNPMALAGVMGNIYAESGLESVNLQNGYEESLGMDNTQYTQAVDNGSYTNFVQDQAGYGLAQWTYFSRKQNLLDFAKGSCVSIGDLNMQLEFLWKELEDLIDIAKLNAATSVHAASDIMLLDFEQPADQSDEIKATRAKYSQVYFDKFVGTVIPPQTESKDSSVPFVVKVTADSLNYRSGPGTGNGVVGTITDHGTYTISEVSDGPGASKWGKLKSGLGWVSLDFVQKL